MDAAALKVCSKCGSAKPRNKEFFNSHCRMADGFCSACKECRNAERAAWRGRNRERHNAYNNASYHSRRVTLGFVPQALKPKRTAEYLKQYRTDWLNRVGRRWDVEYRRNRLATDPAFRMNHTIGTQMRNALGSGKGRRSWTAIVGYSADALRAHLEAQFESWMTWENYGTAWHVDHRRPIASFRFPEQVVECWSLANLRPLAAAENLQKGARIISDVIPQHLQLQEAA